MLYSYLSSSGGKNSLIKILQRVGLTGNLELALDAADKHSYPGSGQTWFDTSGNGRDFYRGANSGSSTDDPTFNGVAGQQDDGTYFSFDGGDLFTEVSANDFAVDWVNTNAAYSIFAMVYLTQGSSVERTIFGTGDFMFGFTSLERLVTFNNSDIEGEAHQSSNAYANNAWAFCVVANDGVAGAGGSFLRLGTTVTTYNGHVNAPITSDNPYNVGGGGNFAGSPLISGTRMSMLAIANRKWSTAEVTALYNEIKAVRHPTLA